MKKLISAGVVMIVASPVRRYSQRTTKSFATWDELLVIPGQAPGTYTWAITWTLKSGQSYRYPGPDMDPIPAAYIQSTLNYPFADTNEKNKGGEYYNPYIRLTASNKIPV